MRAILNKIPCKYCKTIFSVTTHDPNQVFCGRKCFNASRKVGRVVNCFTCGNSVYRRQVITGKKYFCSRTCQHNGIQLKKRN